MTSNYNKKELEKLLLINKEILELEKECIKNNNDPNNYYSKLQNLWLNNISKTRFPIYFEDLIIPKIFKEIFIDIFGDF